MQYNDDNESIGAPIGITIHSYVEHPYTELLIGCGHNLNKQLALPAHKEFEKRVTLDFNPDVHPDIVWDLERMPLPFADESFNEVHAYDVLEHIGQQGDFRAFFRHFTELHRILRPDGHLFATTPLWDSVHAWGDPGHKRVINESTISFLSQEQYKTVDKSPMTDYRNIYHVDFEIIHAQETNGHLCFILKKK